MVKRIFSLLLILSFVFCNFIFAETIILKSGKEIEGEITEKTDKYIKISVEGIPVKYYFDEIERIESSVNADNSKSKEENKDKPTPSNNQIVIDGNPQDWEKIPLVIQDEEGDVRKTDAGKEVYEFDVKNIAMHNDDTYLYIFIDFNQLLDYYFQKNRKYSKIIGTIFLDTDMNQDTGGKEIFSKLSGFESHIEVWSGVKTKDGSTSASGGAYIDNLDEDAELEYFMVCIPSEYDPDKDTLNTDFDKKINSYENNSLIAYGDDFLEFKIPFADLNVNPENSKKIRVLFSEQGSGSFGMGKDTFSEEGVFVLNL